jgi:hypothetical protein
MISLRRAALLSAGLLLLPQVGCGEKPKEYAPRPAYSGKKLTLPAVPTLPQKKKKDGDAFTIWGLLHDFRSRIHSAEVSGKPVVITGYIVKINYDDAPDCALHKPGKEDPPDCKAPIPAFWIADDKNEKTEMIQVMGWASNYAGIWGMIEEIDKAKKGEEEKAKRQDAIYGVDMPNPLPTVGSKVKVHGQFGPNFNKGSGGTASNPRYGIITWEKMEYIEKPAEKVYLKGMKKKDAKK